MSIPRFDRYKSRLRIFANIIESPATEAEVNVESKLKTHLITRIMSAKVVEMMEERQEENSEDSAQTLERWKTDSITNTSESGEPVDKTRG